MFVRSFALAVLAGAGMMTLIGCGDDTAHRPSDGGGDASRDAGLRSMRDGSGGVETRDSGVSGGCRSAAENTAELCADDCDNDGDGRTDCMDFGCSGILGCMPIDAGLACHAACDDRTCGPDGCGGTCGECEEGTSCSLSGTCVPDCTPSCPLSGCGGPDGCGGTCGCPTGQVCDTGTCIPSCCSTFAGACNRCADGTPCAGSCPSGQYCDSGGTCRSTCSPSCAGRACGSDGCGGSCGSCPTGAVCGSDGQCFCDTAREWFPNEAHTACVRANGACDGVSTIGHCVGDIWVWCDPSGGPSGSVEYMNCVAQGLPGCTSVGSSGACACGPIDSNGTCGGSSNEYHFYCLSGYRVLAQDSCRQYGTSGFCSTFVTSFGYQTSCYCSACRYWNASSRTCSSLCSGCTYDSSGNYHYCPP